MVDIATGQVVDAVDDAGLFYSKASLSWSVLCDGARDLALRDKYQFQWVGSLFTEAVWTDLTSMSPHAKLMNAV
jgi:hypothetical protein